VDGEGHPYRETRASKVKHSADCDVDDFRDALKDKCDRQGDDLKGILGSKLVVYANKAAFERNV
jgi:hypothetical protein